VLAFPNQISDKLSGLASSLTNNVEQIREPAGVRIKNEIEQEICELYQLSEIEKALVNYSIDISIPILLREKGSTIFKALNLSRSNDKQYIVNYVNCFLKRINLRYSKLKGCIYTEVLFSDYFIRINFVIADCKNEPICFKRTENTDLETLMGDLGIYSVCRNLYIQQDVRGFLKKSFYLIKPNEKKLWHTAVAYLDALEFEEEIVKAETSYINQKT
jgi:hypothetical protein